MDSRQISHDFYNFKAARFCQLSYLNLPWINKSDAIGGPDRNRTGVHGFAIRCVTTPPQGLNSPESILPDYVVSQGEYAMAI